MTEDGQLLSKTTDKVSEKEIRAGDKDKAISPIISAPTSKPTFPKLAPEVPPPPFPQRLRKANQDKQFSKVLEIIKQLHINIPLVEALGKCQTI